MKIKELQIGDKSNKFIFLLNLILIAASLIMSIDKILIYGFYFVYAIIIYLVFAKNTSRYLYFTTLFYIIVTSGSSKYVFIFFFLYCLNCFIAKLNNNLRYTNIRSKNNRKYYMFFIIFAAYVLLSFFLAKNKSAALTVLYRYALMVAAFAMVFVENLNRGNLKETMKFFFYIYLGILAVGTLQIFKVDFKLGNVFIDKKIEYDYVKRIPVAFFYNPNNYSVILNIGVALLMTRMAQLEFNKKYIGYGLIFIISIVNIIFCGSRISWVVVFLTIILFLIGGIILWIKDVILRKKLLAIGLSFMVITATLFYGLYNINSMKPYYGKMVNSVIVNNIKSDLSSKKENTASALQEEKQGIGEPVNKENGDTDSTTDTAENNTEPPRKSENKTEPAIKLEVGGKGSENERITLISNVLKGIFQEKNYFGFGVGNIGEYIEKQGNTNGKFHVHSFWFEILGDFGVIIFIYVIGIYCVLLLDLLSAFVNGTRKNRFLTMGILIVASINVLLAFLPSTVLRFSPFWIITSFCFAYVCSEESSLNFIKSQEVTNET